MKKTTLLLSLSVLSALPSFAQEKKPDPAAAPKEGAAQAKSPTERPKDDALTAKDAAVKQIDDFIKAKGPAKKEGNWRTSLAQPPKATFAPDAQYEWHLATSKGPM